MTCGECYGPGRQEKLKLSLDQGGCDPHHKLMKKSQTLRKESQPLQLPSLIMLYRGIAASLADCWCCDDSMQAERERTGEGRWFDLPAPQLTPELKNDLKLLRMRNALDPARHGPTDVSVKKGLI